MSDTATPVNLGTIGVFYVEGELTQEAAAEVERLGYTAVWIAGTREARLTIVERFGEDDLADRGSDALVDALVAQGDAATAAEQLRTQLNAGASHLVANAVPSADRLPILTALAPELGVAAR